LQLIAADCTQPIGKLSITSGLKDSRDSLEKSVIGTGEPLSHAAFF